MEPEARVGKRSLWRSPWGSAVVCLVVLVLVSVALYLRGTTMDEAERNPSTADDSRIVQLVAAPNGGQRVRCAAVFEASVERVMAVLTDYKNFSAMFDSLFWDLVDVNVEAVAEGRSRMTATMKTLVGAFPIEVVLERVADGGEQAISWDGSSSKLSVNRGSWTVKPLGPQQTLVVYALTVQVPPYPAFLINNVLLSQAPLVLDAVGERLAAKRP